MFSSACARESAPRGAGSPADCASAVSGRFDVVVDNNGKDLEACQPVVDWAVENGAKQFLQHPTTCDILSVWTAGRS